MDRRLCPRALLFRSIGSFVLERGECRTESASETKVPKLSRLVGRGFGRVGSGEDVGAGGGAETLAWERVAMPMTMRITMMGLDW